MAEEVEYLKDKFIDALGGSDGDPCFSNNSKVPCLALFRELKPLIQNKTIPPLSNGDDPLEALRDFRDKLFELQMLLGDCLKLSKDRNLFNIARNRFLIGEIQTKLTKIKDELRPDQGSPPIPPVLVPVPDPVSADDSTQQSDVKNVDNSRTRCRSMQSELIGFKEEVVAMEKMVFGELNADKFKGIGVVGKKGIGKTALAQVIFNKKQVKKHFLPRIWVRMPKHKDGTDITKEVVKRMLDALGVEDEVVELAEGEGLAGLLFALQLQLWGKRYLIVLDDVWHNDPWYGNLGAKLTEISELAKQLAYGFPKGHGGTVIVTGRDEDVVTKMVPKENVYRVLPLSDPENVWAVFMEFLKGAWVLKYKNEDREFSDKEEEIILESEILQRPNPEEFKGIGIFGENYKATVVRNVFNKMQKEEVKEDIPADQKEKREDIPIDQKEEKKDSPERFKPAIWVSLSKQQDETEITDKQIVKKMLKELQVNQNVIEEADGTGEKSALLSALQLRLQGNKFLIVLDDVWSKVQVTIQEGKFGSWLEEISKWGEAYGARLIVTSREKEIAAEMVGKQNIYEQPHTSSSSKEHAWWIYINAPIKKRSDGIEENRRSDLEFLKNDVVKKCQGFPVAAKLMGQLMYDQLKNAEKPTVQPDVNLEDNATGDTSGIIDAQPADDTHVSNEIVPPQAENSHTDNETVPLQADVSITSGTVSAPVADVPLQDDGWSIVEAGSTSPADEPHANTGTNSVQADGSLTNGVHTTAAASAPVDTNNETAASTSADDSETNAITARPAPPVDASQSNRSL